MAFTIAELRYLESTREFASEQARTLDTTESIKALIMVGGGILAKRDFRSSALRRSNMPHFA